MNKTLCEKLRIYCQNIEDWDTHLKDIVMGINANINKVTRKSPFCLMHEFEPRLRLLNEWEIETSKISEDIELEKQESKQKTIDEQKALQRRSKPNRLSRLKTGDLVLREIKAVNLHKGNHFTPKFKGPYLIVKLLDKDCAVLYCFKSKKEVICNLNHLKKYFGKKPKGYINIKTRYGMELD